jgi:hypothetical protein
LRNGGGLTAKEQYDEFARWLNAKYREIHAAYDAAESDIARAKYNAVLNQIINDCFWLEAQLRKLNA